MVLILHELLDREKLSYSFYVLHLDVIKHFFNNKIVEKNMLKHALTFAVKCRVGESKFYLEKKKKMKISKKTLFELLCFKYTINYLL